MNKFKITIDEQNFDVTVNVTEYNKANVEVNGIAYDVVYESKNVPSAPVARKAAISPAHTCTRLTRVQPLPRAHRLLLLPANKPSNPRFRALSLPLT